MRAAFGLFKIMGWCGVSHKVEEAAVCPRNEERKSKNEWDF
jgi:hypothetical protein